jgi:hypothetical protein
MESLRRSAPTGKSPTGKSPKGKSPTGKAPTVALWWHGRARLADLDDPASTTGWFPWAVIGTAALSTIARELGLTVGDRHAGERNFVELRRPR